MTVTALTGMYVAEIPPGGALEPERHLYKEIICILDGNVMTQCALAQFLQVQSCSLWRQR
jgi:hypothetical protein